MTLTPGGRSHNASFAPSLTNTHYGLFLSQHDWELKIKRKLDGYGGIKNMGRHYRHLRAAFSTIENGDPAEIKRIYEKAICFGANRTTVDLEQTQGISDAHQHAYISTTLFLAAFLL